MTRELGLINKLVWKVFYNQYCCVIAIVVVREYRGVACSSILQVRIALLVAATFLVETSEICCFTLLSSLRVCKISTFYGRSC